MEITTTLAKLRKHGPCKEGWKKLVKSLGGIKGYGENTPISFRQIFESNGYSDAMWCLRSIDKEHHRLLRHFAADCAQSVTHLSDDKRVTECIRVVRLYADGLATESELDAVRAAAWAAAWAVARAAAWEAAGAAARAAKAAARAAAWEAAGGAARAVAWDAARFAQIKLLLMYLESGERPENSAELLIELMGKGGK